MELGRLANRPDRPQRVIHVLGDLLQLRVALGGRVDRDAVVGPMDLAGEKCLVVEGIIPGGGAWSEVLVKLLGVVERFFRLRGIESDLIVLIDDVATERPQAPVHPAVAVAGGVA